MVRITDETYPVISFQSFGKSHEADVALLRPVYQRVFKRARPIICLSDARLATHSADQRKLWADWVAETIREDVNACTVATVVLLDSSLLRGALIALNWITPPRVPQYVFGELDAALDECRKIADKHDLHVPGHVFGQIRSWIDAGRAAAPARRSSIPVR